MNLFLCFLAMTFTLWPHNVSAQTIQRCTEQLQERTAAMTARDWSSLDKLAKRYVQSCHGVTDALDISTAYEDMAIANLLMNRVQNALEAANSCVTTYYANPGCHLQKARALLAFNR